MIRKRDKSAPVPIVEPGEMHLRVRCDGKQAERVRERLIDAGAALMNDKVTA
ncbi:MAG: hypothetical protein WDO18_01255 [Acidobacteriota bacterium]